MLIERLEQVQGPRLKKLSIFQYSKLPVTVRRYTQPLSGSASSGYDGITKADLIFLYDIIKDSLVDLVNNVLTTANFPPELKTAKITQLHAKGPHDKINNYRPISLLNSFSKVVEKKLRNVWLHL